MTNEEKKAVDYWKNYMKILHWNTQLASEHYMKVLLDLIEKQNKNIKELESDKEIKDKMIKEMTEFISNTNITHNICAEEGCYDDDDELKGCQNCIKQYFENLAKESGEIDENKSN